MKVYEELKCTFAGRKNTVKLEPDGEMHYLEAISQAERSFSYHKRVLVLVADNGNNANKQSSNPCIGTTSSRITL